MIKDKLYKGLKFTQFFVDYAHDLWSFIRNNGYSPLVDKNKRLFYKIIIETHTIEKGLSLASPKLLFGKDKIRFVMSALDKYDQNYSEFPVEMALGALSAYLEFHQNKGIDDPFLTEIINYLSRWSASSDIRRSGGVKNYTPPTDPSTFEGGQRFLLSRSSCRVFDGKPLPMETIKKVVEIAQGAPSQCNRQSSKIHIYQKREMIDALLALQGGARGFSQNVGNLLVISSEVAAWGGAGQRNQLYVDGALFASHVLLACHSMGLAACPLNLAVTNSMERKIRSVAAIPDGERLIMMIAVGQVTPGPLSVARSPRRDISEVIHIHI